MGIEQNMGQDFTRRSNPDQGNFTTGNPIALYSPPSTDSYLYNAYIEPYNGKPKYVHKRPGIVFYKSNPPGATFPNGYAGGGYTPDTNASGAPAGYSYFVIGTGFYNANGTNIAAAAGLPLTVSRYLMGQGKVTTNNAIVVQNATAVYVYNLGLNTFTKVSFTPTGSGWVPGVALLDGTTYMMDNLGNIYGSAINDSTSYTALNVVNACQRGDYPIGLTRNLDYILAFTSSAVQFYYDAANPSPGSPLSLVQGSTLTIGAVNGLSIKGAYGKVFFLGRGTTGGPSVFMLDGMTPSKVSTPAIEDYMVTLLQGRSINDVAFNGSAIQPSFVGNILDFGEKLFYVLTIQTAPSVLFQSTYVHLVYDLVAKTWYEWRFDKAPTSVSGTYTVLAADGATATVSGSFAGPLPGISVGATVVITAADDTTLLGNRVVTATDGATFITFTNPTVLVNGNGNITVAVPGVAGAYGIVTASSETSAAPSTPVVQLAGSDASAFTDWGMPARMQIGAGQDVVLTTTAIPVTLRIQTLDDNLGTQDKKTCSSLEIVGDKVYVTGTSQTDYMMVQYSDNDYQVFKPTVALYSYVPLGLERSKIYRLGNFRRRAFVFQNTSYADVRLETYEIEAYSEKGQVGA